jgi:hypothetical protein
MRRSYLVACVNAGRYETVPAVVSVRDYDGKFLLEVTPRGGSWKDLDITRDVVAQIREEVAESLKTAGIKPRMRVRAETSIRDEAISEERNAMEKVLAALSDNQNRSPIANPKPDSKRCIEFSLKTATQSTEQLTGMRDLLQQIADQKSA